MKDPINNAKNRWHQISVARFEMRLASVVRYSAFRSLFMLSNMSEAFVAPISDLRISRILSLAALAASWRETAVARSEFGSGNVGGGGGVEWWYGRVGIACRREKGWIVWYCGLVLYALKMGTAASFGKIAFRGAMWLVRRNTFMVDGVAGVVGMEVVCRSCGVESLYKTLSSVGWRARYSRGKEL
jgi:hypothetical protein